MLLELFRNETDPDKAPMQTALRQLSTAQTKDLNRGIAWLEWLEEQEAQPDVCDPETEIAASPPVV